jgi:SAM-dependent methyltransferase
LWRSVLRQLFSCLRPTEGEEQGVLQMQSADHQDLYTEGRYRQSNEDWHDEDGPVKAREICSLLEKNRISFRSCADIGCGTGRVTKIMAAAFDADFFGYDISDIPLHSSEQKLKNVKFVVGDFFDVTVLPSYDLIMLNDVVEHIPDCFLFLNKIKRYSEYLILRLPIEINVLHTLTNRQVHNRRRLGHLHYFSKDTALATVEECGLTIVDWQYVFDGLNMPHTSRSLLKIALKGRRLIALNLFPDIGVRLFGGAGILILARNPLFTAEMYSHSTSAPDVSRSRALD